jgi:hypothetical protein
VDGDANGIGDTPYHIPPNSVDNHPLMEPFEQTSVQVSELRMAGQVGERTENVAVQGGLPYAAVGLRKLWLSATP